MKKSPAFSLTELAVVMVVISMIVTGIFTADGLRTQYKIQSIISDYQYYTRAIRSFQSMYGYLPGDFPNAGALWSSPASNNCTNAVQTAGCNGSGGGVVGGATFGSSSVRAWQHLALAGLITGNYNGNNSTIPNTIPALKLQGMGIELRNYPALGVNVNSIVIGGLVSNCSNYGLPTQTGGTYVKAIGLSSEFYTIIAKAIDVKLDDGVANTGIILSLGDCSYPYTNTTGNDYLLNVPYAWCYMVSRWYE